MATHHLTMEDSQNSVWQLGVEWKEGLAQAEIIMMPLARAILWRQQHTCSLFLAGSGSMSVFAGIGTPWGLGTCPLWRGHFVIWLIALTLEIQLMNLPCQPFDKLTEF